MHTLSVPSKVSATDLASAPAAPRRIAARRARAALAALLLCAAAAPAFAIGSAFTYQGALNRNGQPASGDYDLQFALQDQGGAPLGTLTFDDVALVGGLFTVELDFGPAAFDGGERFLAIAVRDGASTGAYLPLAPRTRVTAAPYAQAAIVASFAEGVAADTVAGPQLVDGSITAADIDANQVQRRIVTQCAAGSSIRSVGSDGSVVCEIDDGGSGAGTVTSIVAGSGLNGGTITTSGTLSVNTATIQARVTGECPTGQYMRQVQQSGQVACESVPAGGGTVTAVNTGAGLAGGPITGSGTLSIATGGVTGSMIATGAVGATQINTNEVQRRILGGCGGSDFVAGIGADGALVCAALPLEFLRTPESVNDVGAFPSIALRPDGRPVIAHIDRTNGDLRLFACTDSGCTSGTARVLDTVADAQQTAIAIRPDGRPLVAYSASGLQVHDCADAACSSGTERVLDAGPGDGLGASMALREDGRALIGYVAFGAAEARVFDCADVGCSSGVVRVVDPNLTVSVGDGQRTAVAIGIAGTAWIAYQDATPDDVRIVRCTTPDCSIFGNPRTLDAANSVGAWLSMVTNAAGVPHLAYLDATSGLVRLAICASATSCASSTIRDLQAFGATSATSIAVRGSGEPVIAYQNGGGDNDLVLTLCGDTTCNTSDAEVLANGGSVDPVGVAAALVLRADGRPVVAHRSEPAGDLLLALCADPACSD